jgi:pimeloyl-ACP methyl ester carboxylesterase
MIEYAIHGSGPHGVIALHGLFTTGDGFRSIFAAFDPAEWTVVLPDLRGYGRSRDQAGPFDIETAAADSLEVVDALGWSSFDVVGHSMGGKIGLRLALSAGKRVRRMVGLSPIWAGRIEMRGANLERFQQSVQDASARAAIIDATTGSKLPSYWCASRARESLAQSTPEAYQGYLNSFRSYDFAREAATLSLPVLIITGQEDAANVSMAYECWQRLMRDVTVTVVQESGHWGLQEMPLRLAALIQKYLLEGRLGNPATRS